MGKVASIDGKIVYINDVLSDNGSIIEITNDGYKVISKKYYSIEQNRGLFAGESEYVYAHSNSSDGIILYYNRNKGKFESITPKFYVSTKSNISVEAFFQGKSNVLLLENSDGSHSIVFINKTKTGSLTKKVYNVPTPPLIKHLTKEYVEAFVNGKTDFVNSITDGIYKVDRKKQQIEKIPLPFNGKILDGGLFRGTNNMFVVETKSKNGYLMKYDDKTGNIVKLHDKPFAEIFVGGTVTERSDYGLLHQSEDNNFVNIFKIKNNKIDILPTKFRTVYLNKDGLFNGKSNIFIANEINKDIPDIYKMDTKTNSITSIFNNTKYDEIDILHHGDEDIYFVGKKHNDNDILKYNIKSGKMRKVISFGGKVITHKLHDNGLYVLTSNNRNTTLIDIVGNNGYSFPSSNILDFIKFSNDDMVITEKKIFIRNQNGKLEISKDIKGASYNEKNDALYYRDIDDTHNVILNISSGISKDKIITIEGIDSNTPTLVVSDIQNGHLILKDNMLSESFLHKIEGNNAKLIYHSSVFDSSNNLDFVSAGLSDYLLTTNFVYHLPTGKKINIGYLYRNDKIGMQHPLNIRHSKIGDNLILKNDLSDVVGIITGYTLGNIC